MWRCAAGRSWPNLVVAHVEVFVPQSHWPGEEAEVDFGDVVVEL
jgi:hypothetical protein